VPGTSPSPAQTPPLSSPARLPWMIASFWPSRTSSIKPASRTSSTSNSASVEPHLDVRSLLQVHRIDEAHLPLIERQNHRTCAHAFAEKPDALQQISVRHSRARENHFLPRRQIFGVVNTLQILHAHFCQAFRVLRLADHQPRKNLPIQAAQRRGRKHAFRRAARAHHCVHARSDHRRGNPGREVAIANQPDARTRRAYLFNELFVPRPVQYDHHEIFNVAVQPLGNRLQVVGYRCIQVHRAFARRSHDQFFHVQVGRVQQPAALARRQHRDGIRRARRAQVRSFQRIHGDVHLRKQCFRSVRPQSYLFADVQHRRFIALAFTNHNRPVNLHRVHRLAHRFHGHFIGVVPVAESHRARRRNRRVFHHAQKIQAKLFFHPSLSSILGSAGILVGDFLLASPFERARHHKPKHSYPSTIYDLLAIPLGRIRTPFFLVARLGYNAARWTHVQIAQEPTLAPWSRYISVLPGQPSGPQRDQFIRSKTDPGALPSNDTDIAFASVTQLSRWIEQRKLTSERLTQIYLRRIEQFDPKLRCVITLTRDLALAQAKKADEEIAAGKYRGPLHGIPWGGKDLLDTARIPTTNGAEPFRNRIPKDDAAVVKRLHAAGAVLLAKLCLGALALNDIWFGGQTVNPWLLEEGASGSSAGPGAATAAGLVGFSIGSETGGSIISPSMRCGITGLRPTYGRVPRTGAMTLCWSLDKLGPMTRTVEDALLVLQAISGPDAGDISSVPTRLDFDSNASIKGLRVGYFPAWMKEDPATDVDRAALATLPKLGLVPVEVSLPNWPYNSLNLILFAEGAAAFEELTLSHGVDQLKVQTPDAWPNLFRQARFLSAVDFVQADRLRRKVAEEMARIFSQVDLLLVPSLRDEMLTISNNTGHPSLTLRAGFVEVSEARSDWAPDPKNPLPKFSPPRRVPHGITLIGRLFEEGTLGRRHRPGARLRRRQPAPTLFLIHCAGCTFGSACPGSRRRAI